VQILPGVWYHGSMNRERLDRILADHSLWLGSNEKQGKRANLARANLRGAQLDIQVRHCRTFKCATVSEEQLAWLCQHPKLGELSTTLTLTVAEASDGGTTT